VNRIRVSQEAYLNLPGLLALGKENPVRIARLMGFGSVHLAPPIHRRGRTIARVVSNIIGTLGHVEAALDIRAC
jgi:hypothetical protein